MERNPNPKAHGCLALFAPIQEGEGNRAKYPPGLNMKWVPALACRVPVASTEIFRGGQLRIAQISSRQNRQTQNVLGIIQVKV